MLSALVCAAALSTQVSIEDLPLIDPDVTVLMSSSHNKQGLNGDGGYWLYSEEGAEPGLVGWSDVDEGATATFEAERVYAGRGALRHRVTRAGRDSGWRSVVKALSAGLNVSDCDALVLRVWPQHADGGTDYGVRIDSGGSATELPIADLIPGQWNEVAVDISQVPRAGVERVWLLFHLDWGCPEETCFFVDDIAFRRPDGSLVPVDDFEGGAEWRVVCDTLGPGCVRNMWGLGGGRLRLEVDGEVLVDAEQTEIYDGLAEPFAQPLVSRRCVSSGPWLAEAHWSFTPIPFRERCRILTTAPFPFNHYIVEHYRDDRDPAATATREREQLGSYFAAVGVDPKAWEYTGSSLGESRVEPGQRVEIARIEGAGAIGRIRLRIVPRSPAVLDGARLEIRWDGATEPAVDAPLGIFFGAGVEWRPVSSLLIGTQGDAGYCFFPMPFWEGARVSIFNGSGEPIEDLGWEIAWTDRTYPRGSTGSFHAQFRHDPATALGRDYLFAGIAGRGQFVGVVHTLIGGHYCEGDIRFYTDGSRTPQLYGTGSEDYYHCACWPNMDQHTPFHGCVGDVGAEAAARGISFYDLRACYYRFHLEAPIRFENGGRFGIEHGGTNDTVSDYTSLAFWYSQPEAGLTECDRLAMGEAASERAHGLVAQAAERGELTGFFEGDDDDIPWTFGSLATSAPLRVSLEVPRENRGVRLRRVLDQLAGRQCAEVIVDGRSAGLWYDPDENRFMRLAESDFEIAPALTRGKERLEVEFRPLENSPPWTLLELRALAHVR